MKLCSCQALSIQHVFLAEKKHVVCCLLLASPSELTIQPGHEHLDAHGGHHGRGVQRTGGSAAARVDEALHHCAGATDAEPTGG